MLDRRLNTSHFHEFIHIVNSIIYQITVLNNLSKVYISQTNCLCEKSVKRKHDSPTAWPQFRYDSDSRYNEKHVCAPRNGSISQAFAGKTHFTLFQLSPTLTLHINTLQKIYSKIDSITQTCFTTACHFRLTQKWSNLQCKIPVCFFSVLFQVLSLAHFADRHQSDLWYQTIWGERERQRWNWKPRITSVCVRTALWEVGLGEKY